MSYVSELKLKQNDYGNDLEFQMTDAEDNPVDLTGATVKVIIAEEGATEPKVERNATITDAENGLIKITVIDGDFDEAPKDYLVEAEATYLDRVVSNVEFPILKIIPELAET